MTERISLAAPRRGLWDRPLLLLSITALIWAGHSVVGKLAVGEIPPMTLTFYRWLFAAPPIFLAARPTLAADFRALAPRWPYVAALGALGYTAFNALFYLAAHYTTGFNLSLIQACVPALVLIGAGIAFHARPTFAQGLGAALTIAGVAVIAAQGDLSRLGGLAFNFGDALMLIACCLYAFYAVGLRFRPAVSSIGFLAALALAALVTSIPPFLWEAAHVGVRVPSLRGVGVMIYASIGVAFVSQLLFMRGVELIGPGRAGVFVNLVPIFGALLAVGVLGEPLAGYHVAALALVVGGIALAQVRRSPRSGDRRVEPSARTKL